MISTSEIKLALSDLRGRAPTYDKCERYYAGAHDLAFATEKFKNAFGELFRTFADNLMPSVCDAVADKLQVTSFRVEEGEAGLDDEAWEIWQQNRMDSRAGEVHLEALKTGDAYVIVWPDAEGNPTIYPNRASLCTVKYDEEIPGQILWGAKLWFTKGLPQERKARLNLYFPDRIEKYITVKAQPNGMPDDKTEWIEFQIEGEAWPLTHEWGVVPVFHFANNAAVGRMGNSELKDVMPLQDGLNKAILDMMVAMEFAAFRQRWATGIEMDVDKEGKLIPPFVPGVERLWASDDPDTKFGSFDVSELEQFTKAQDTFRSEIARVSGTPLHYMMLGGGDMSGIALQMMEARYLSKVRDRHGSFGNVWEDVMKLALRMKGKGADLRLFTNWADPSPVSEKEQLNALILKSQLGVPDEQLWEEAGYGASDIQKMKQIKQKQREEAQQEFNSQ